MFLCGTVIENKERFLHILVTTFFQINQKTHSDAKVWGQASDWADSLSACSHSTCGLKCQPSAAIALLLSDFVSHFGSHYCWFMSVSTEQFALADKIKFHTPVQCQLPLSLVFILMMILTAGDDDNWPADTELVSCDELHSRWKVMTLL